MDKLELNELFLVSFGDDERMERLKTTNAMQKREVGQDDKLKKTYLYL